MFVNQINLYTFVKDYELRVLRPKLKLLLFSCKYYKSSVVSLGVTLIMTVELNSNSNVTIETKTKGAIN